MTVQSEFLKGYGKTKALPIPKWLKTEKDDKPKVRKKNQKQKLMAIKKTPRGDATPIKKYGGKYMPYPGNPLPKQAKKKKITKNINIWT